jgi:hypothetical protein
MSFRIEAVAMATKPRRGQNKNYFFKTKVIVFYSAMRTEMVSKCWSWNLGSGELNERRTVAKDPGALQMISKRSKLPLSFKAIQMT